MLTKNGCRCKIIIYNKNAKKAAIKMSSKEQTKKYYETKIEALISKMPDYVQAYIDDIQDCTSERTRYEYALDIHRLLSSISNGNDVSCVPADSLGMMSYDDFIAYFTHLSNYENNGHIICNGNASIKRKLSALRSFYAYLQYKGIVQNDAIFQIETPKIAAVAYPAISEKQINTLIEQIKSGKGFSTKEKQYNKLLSARDIAIISLMASAGLRISECVEADIDDIDMCNKCINLPEYDDSTDDAANQNSQAYFSDMAAVYLLRYIKQRNAITGIADKNALFLSSRKKRISIRMVQTLIKKYASYSKLTQSITPDRLRTAPEIQLPGTKQKEK